MKNLHNENMFTQGDHLTKEQLVQYHLGQMSKQERFNVEKHMVDCELCRDAVSAMPLIRDYKGIEKLRKELRRLAKPNEYTMNTVAWRITLITIAVLAVIILLVLIYIYAVTANGSQ